MKGTKGINHFDREQYRETNTQGMRHKMKKPNDVIRTDGHNQIHLAQSRAPAPAPAPRSGPGVIPPPPPPSAFTAPPVSPAPKAHEKYMNEDGDLDLPDGDKVDRIVTVAKSRLDGLVDEVMDNVVAIPLKEAIRAILAKEADFVNKEIAGMDIDPSLKEQALASYSYNRQWYEDEELKEDEEMYVSAFRAITDRIREGLLSV